MPDTINLLTGDIEYRGLSYVKKSAAPTTSDTAYAVPSGWLDTTNNEWYIHLGSGTWTKSTGVEGPASSTDNAVARFDGTGGETLQNSGVTIDDSDNVSGVASMTVDAGGDIRTATGAGNAMTLAAYDVDGTSYTDFITFTANNTPTCDLSTSVTMGSNAIYYASGTDVPVADGGTGASTAGDARTNLGLAIGTDVQAYDAGLADIAGLAVTDGNIIVGDGANWVAESGATARTSLGLGTIATQASDSVSITGGSVTGITDITVADGGTGRSSHTAYAVLCGGTSGTGAQQSIAGLGSSGQVLTSNGAGALPTMQTLPAATDVSDATFRIQDNVDATKEIAFEASGITTSTVRTITMDDANVDLSPNDGTYAAAAGGTQITTLGTVTTGTWNGTTIAVANGGTGATTLTDGGILLGSGTGAITATAVLADGEMIVGDGTTDPAIESGATLRTSIGVSIGSDVQAWDAQLDDIAALAVTDGNIIVGDGANWVAESGATARTSLGLTIGTDVQAYDAGLADIAGLAVTDGNIIVGDGANWVAESGATARTSLGLGTGDSPTFTGVTLSGSGLNPAIIESTDAGAAAGPTLDIYRNSASAANSDIIGDIAVNGRNSTPAKYLYVNHYHQIITATASSEDARYVLQVSDGGSLRNVIDANSGNLALYGTIDGTSPPSGAIGEVLTASLAVGSRVDLTSNTWANLTSITLTPGVWNISGAIHFVNDTTPTGSSGNMVWENAISTTSASSSGTTPGIDYASLSGTGIMPINGVGGMTVQTNVSQKIVTSNTTYYLNARGYGSSSFDAEAYGTINATRVS